MYTQVPEDVLIDKFKRIHTYLRLSVTDQCNFRCVYCMPEEQTHFLPGNHLMTRAEIFKMASVFTQLGVNKIRLTGGEPLLRKDIGNILMDLSSLDVELTLTTNGFFIDKYISQIKQSGVKSLNLSIDSLCPDSFAEITKRNYFNRVWQNIKLLLDEGIHLKLNVVVMKHINTREITDFVELTRNWPIEIRFIEFMPFDGNQWDKLKVVTHTEILNIIDAKYSFLKLTDAFHDTSRKYKVYGFEGSFAVITTMSEPFCEGCNRIRVTADGKLKNCLFSASETDLLTAMRHGVDINNLILDNILSKHKRQGGQLAGDYQENVPHHIHNRSMINIGG